jgi:hypothetical protein
VEISTSWPKTFAYEISADPKFRVPQYLFDLPEEIERTNLHQSEGHSS